MLFFYYVLLNIIIQFLCKQCYTFFFWFLLFCVTTGEIKFMHRDFVKIGFKCRDFNVMVLKMLADIIVV